ncbi:MAG: peptide deformylase [Anaerolineales bacterium]|nr:peptide deformylase [Anaerolineales bacterium]
MAVRKILLYSEHRETLREKSGAVPLFNRTVRRIIRDLKDTLQAHSEGIGLAAPQINIQKRVVIFRPGLETDGEWRAGLPVALVNPEIVEASGKRRDFDGCLSFPGLYGETTRPHHLRVTGLDEAGRPCDHVYDGFNAVVVHHEIDHLDGILFIDRIENPQDLYTLRRNEQGDTIRVPFTVG